MAVVLGATGGFTKLRRTIRQPAKTALIIAAGLIITVNWGTYIYGVNTGRVVEASLGYFMNPLVTVLAGVVILREKLRRLQWVALAAGGLAVVVFTVGFAHPPWIALVLGVSFASYGLVKKQLNLPAAESLFGETTALLIPALATIAWLQFAGKGTFGQVSIGHALLLAGSGAITAIPLLFFAGAANRISMTALGMGQYIAPTIQFVIGVAVFGETMTPQRWTGFALVWAALAIFTVDAVRQNRRARNVTEPVPIVEASG